MGKANCKAKWAAAKWARTRRQGRMSRRKLTTVNGQEHKGEGNWKGEWARANGHEQGGMGKWAGANEQGYMGTNKWTMADE